jgi:hypothetical protein
MALAQRMQDRPALHRLVPIEKVRQGSSSAANFSAKPPRSIAFIASPEGNARPGEGREFMPCDRKAPRIVGNRAWLGPMHPDQRASPPRRLGSRRSGSAPPAASAAARPDRSDAARRSENGRAVATAR